MKNIVYILGTSGHSKVVLAILLSKNIPVAGFYAETSALAGTLLCGLPVLGGQEEFAKLENPCAVIAIGNCAIRARVARMSRHATWITAVHAASWVDPSALLGPGTVVCAGGMVQPGAVIGAHGIINTGATVDHDCVLEDFVHVCPGAHLGGNVRIGQGSWIGIGSQVVQGIRIGANVTVGAGSTVLADVLDNAVVVGSPARIVRYTSC